MQWWSWVAVGVVLLGAELTFVNAQFYLVFIGVSALSVGLLALAGLATAAWLQWLVFIVIALVSLMIFRGPIYRRMRPNLPEMTDGLSGELVLVPVDLAAGQSCRLDHRGSNWDAVNDGAGVIVAGSRARIIRVEGLKLYLQAH